MRRHAAYLLCRHQEPRGHAGRDARAADLALHRLHHRGRTRPRLGARHRGRHARHAAGSASLRKGLSGRLRIAAIPTALAMVSALTTPFRARHPNVKFTILSRTSIEILAMLENLEVDAGLTYIDNEPLGRIACGAALHRAVSAAHLGEQPARRARQRHLGGGRRDPALPADAGHAEPAHHRPAPAPRRAAMPIRRSNPIR